MSDNKNQLVPVLGYLSHNWLLANDATPAVIVNPAATTHDLLAWCWGEMESLRSTAILLSQSHSPIEVGEFSAVILQRLEPLATVFDVAVSQVMADRDATQAEAS